MRSGDLTKKIEKAQQGIVSHPRDYIGASIIGSDCFRQIWYEFKGEKQEKIPPKTRRTWAVGSHLEHLILDWIELSGCAISREWYDLQSNNIPQFKGHVDAILVDKKGNPIAIIEVKTAKDASFNVFLSKGLKLWNPRYYAQIQSYMGMSGIHKAYIVVFNKDSSDIMDELVVFDPEFYRELEEKAQFVVGAVSAPPRISGSPLWYQCKLCQFNKVCHS